MMRHIIIKQITMRKLNSIKMKKKTKIQRSKIKLVLTDVDGVLTDGGVYYSSTGEVMKKFHIRDGMGINILLRNRIKTIIVSKENSKIVKTWAKKMNVCEILVGVKRKELELPKICKKYNLNKNQIAFIGDDINDINLLKNVGFSATPSDGNGQVKKNVDYICKNNGGNGAFREFIEIILTRQLKKINWY